MLELEYQKYLTKPPIPFGGYPSKTMNDDEIKEQINQDTDRCMQILFAESEDQMAAKKKVDYTEEINTDRPIKRGTDLVSVGRLETKDAYLLDILKEQGFYLMYNKKETKFGEFEYYQVLYPKEG